MLVYHRAKHCTNMEQKDRAFHRKLI